MAGNDKQDGLTRRGFMKALGIAGIASTGLNTGKALAQEAAGKAPSLPKRKLGKTGVEVSILSLGGMFDTLNNQLLLRQAHNWGVTYWDTAEGYGNGMSEDGFGRYFTRNPAARKDIFLVTKFRQGTAEAMTENLDKALKRLCTEYVDLFFIHGIKDFSEIAEPKPLKQWVAAMKKAGKMKFFGFSTHANMEDCLLAAAKTDWIDAVMFTYNFRLMHTDKMKQALDACTGAGIGLVAMKTQGGGPVKTDSEAELQMAGRFLEKGFTDKQAKIKAVLENPNIASVCSQMPNLTILSANVAAARDLTKLGGSDFELLHRFASETREGYCAGCGRICGDAVAGDVPVSDVMRCLMYYREYGDRELAREVYAGLPREARQKLTEIDYTNAEKICPQGLAIAALMREASELLA
ncbi:MAG: aldo/keto reductase [Desulfobacteraceae bacterium]|nr:aldo/keto reductase [Desulfobacteraceae bacterium]